MATRIYILPLLESEMRSNAEIILRVLLLARSRRGRGYYRMSKSILRLKLLMIFLFCNRSALARLGDTERDCFMRYSSAVQLKQFGLPPEPLIKGAKHLTYHYQGWKIRVALVNGKVEAQHYQKIVPHPTGSKIQEAELLAMLEAEKAQHIWERQVILPDSALNFGASIMQLTSLGQKIWKRSDGAVASLLPGQLELMFFSKSAMDIARQENKATEEKKKNLIPKF